MGDVGQLPVPSKSNQIQVFRFLTLVLSTIFVLFLLFLSLNYTFPNFIKPQNKNTDSVVNFTKKFVDISNWNYSFSGRGFKAKDPEKWEVDLEDDIKNTGKIRMIFWTGYGSKEQPSVEQFFHNQTMDAAAVGEFYRKRGVVDPNFYNKLATQAVKNLDLRAGRVKVAEKWSFTPSKSNNGLSLISFNLDGDVAIVPSLKWYIDPKFVPRDVFTQLESFAKFGVLEERSLPKRADIPFLLFAISLIGTIYYLSLVAVPVVFLAQMVVFALTAFFVIFLFKFAFKNLAQSRIRILWFMLGMLDIFLFYSSLMLILEFNFPLPN